MQIRHFSVASQVDAQANSPYRSSFMLFCNVESMSNFRDTPQRHSCTQNLPIYSHLLPVWPDLVGDILNKLELLEHNVLVHALSSDTDTGETALWANTDLLESLLSRSALTLGDDVGGLEDLVLHLGWVFHLWNLGADNTENDVLLLWQEAERLEATRAWVVVLEVEGVVVESLEEALGNGLVGAL